MEAFFIIERDGVRALCQDTVVEGTALGQQGEAAVEVLAHGDRVGAQTVAFALAEDLVFAVAVA